ncbi:MAG: hypothetical protein QM635_04675 [Microbacteriaceae bacterium]
MLNLVGAGLGAVDLGVLASKALLPALLSPLIAALVALGATRVLYAAVRRRGSDGRASGFRRGQIASASLVSLAHGTDDVQKTMGVITLVLVAAGWLARQLRGGPMASPGGRMPR